MIDQKTLLSTYIKLNVINLILLNQAQRERIEFKKIYYIDNLFCLIKEFIIIKNINNLIITNFQIEKFNRIYEYELTKLFYEYYKLFIIEIKYYNTFKNILDKKFKKNMYNCKTLIDKSMFILKINIFLVLY